MRQCAPFLQVTLATLAGAAGVMGRVACRSTKYALFDPSKEMVGQGGGRGKQAGGISHTSRVFLEPLMAMA